MKACRFNQTAFILYYIHFQALKKIIWACFIIFIIPNKALKQPIRDNRTELNCKSQSLP